MDQEKIGRFIAECRKKQNLTQQELADKLGITDRAISNWENGRSLPDVSLFKILCEIFNISVNELISGEKLSKEKLIKQSDEIIINTLNDNENDKKRTNKIIIILVVGIIILLLSIILIIKNNYPKIDLFNFTIQQADPDLEYKLEKKLNINKRNVFYYGIDFAVFCEKGEKCFDVSNALKYKQITIDDFQDFLNKQVEYENFKISMFYDGGTTVYSKGGMQVIFCNTLDGNRDVYIGNDKMLDKLHGEYCGHERNKSESYTRTYKVLKTSINEEDRDFNDVILEDIDGNTGSVIINNSYKLVSGHTYYFSFLTFDKFYDTIENIFNNSTLLDVVELGEYSNISDWINEEIIVNEDLDSGAELNDLEHVRMDIVDGTLTNKSAKVRITDYTNHKYIYGSDFRIDVKNGSIWTEVKKKNELLFDSMAYGPDLNGHLEFDINWEYAYGYLTPGKYRIVKYALIDKEECSIECKKYYISVEFEIK